MTWLKKLWLNVLRAFFTFMGDVQWHGWTSPMWITINAKGYALRGEHYREIRKVIQPGDILIRRFERYVDKWYIPGWWNHGGVYVGGRKEQVVHAIAEGVVIEDFLNFMRTDHLIILRPPEDMLKEGLKRAREIVGRKYDFFLDFEDHERFSCTELPDYCYPGIITPKRRFGRISVVADDIVNSGLEVVWDSRVAKDSTTVKLGRAKSG